MPSNLKNLIIRIQKLKNLYKIIKFFQKVIIKNKAIMTYYKIIMKNYEQTMLNFMKSFSYYIIIQVIYYRNIKYLMFLIK